MEKKTNPWLISMFAGVCALVIGLTVFGSPVLLGIGGAVALVSGVVVILQAVSARRS